MTEKEIAKEILLKLIDVKAIALHQTNHTVPDEEISAKNEENVKIICDAYQKIFKAVVVQNTNS